MFAPVFAAPLLLTHFLCFSSLWFWPEGVLFPKATRGGAFTPLLGQQLPSELASRVLEFLFRRGSYIDLDGVGVTLFWTDVVFGALTLIAFLGSAKKYSLLKLLPLAPFSGWAFCCLLHAVWPDFAWKVLCIWSLFAASTIAAASILQERVTMVALGWLLLVAIGASIITALVYPAVGQTPPSWVGLFSQKNPLGWFSAVAFLVAVFAPRALGWRFRGVLAAESLVTVWMSQSSTSIGAIIAAAAYGAAIWIVRRFIRSAPGRGAALAAILAGGAASGYALQGVIVGWFGKDETFSGRTTIWQYYIGLVRERPISGWGPGAFTGSPVTWRIAADAAAHHEKIIHAHSLYITLLGEVGWIGVVLYIATLCYLAVGAPATSKRSLAVLTGVLAVAMLVRGVSEAREGFNAGIGAFALLLSFGARTSGRARLGRSGRTDGASDADHAGAEGEMGVT